MLIVKPIKQLIEILFPATAESNSCCLVSTLVFVLFSNSKEKVEVDFKYNQATFWKTSAGFVETNLK